MERIVREKLSVEKSGGSLVVEGIAAVYGAETDIGPFKERIARGAFDESLKSGQDIIFRYNHDRGPQIFGRTSNDSLKVWSDDKYLRYRATLPQTNAGQDLYTLIRDGYVSGSSFVASHDDKDIKWDIKRNARECVRLSLLEVSAVDTPAYQQTSVMARDLADFNKAEAEYWKEKFKKDIK